MAEVQVDPEQQYPNSNRDDLEQLSQQNSQEEIEYNFHPPAE